MRPPSTGQADAGDEIVVDEEEHGLGDVLRPALALDEGGVDGLPALRFRQVGRQQDRAGHDAVDAHARVAAAQLDGQAARQRRDGALGREIGGVAQVGPDLRPVAEGDDAAALRLAHHGQPGVLAAQERAQGVGLEMKAHVRRGHVLQRLLFQTAAQLTSTSSRPKRSSRVLHQGADVALVGQVGLEGGGLDAALSEGRDRLGRLRGRAAVVDGQGVAARGQGIGDVPADAAACRCRSPGPLWKKR